MGSVNFADKFLICKGSSGMGNRMLAACTAIFYSQISGRQLIIDWRDGSYSQDGQNSFNTFFELPEVCQMGHSLNPQELETLMRSESVYPDLWRENLKTSLGALRNTLQVSDRELSCEMSRLDYGEDVLVFCAYTHKIHEMRPLFTQKFQSFSTLSLNEILRTLLRSQFVLKDTISKPIQDFKTSQFGAKTIGVHVRYTDMKMPLDQLMNTTTRIVRRSGADCLFLATDAQEIIQRFQDTFPRVITVPKWFPPPGQRLHQNWEHCPDRIQNGIEALMDLYLMAHCSGLVFSSKSSFGFVASLLSQAEPQHLYDVSTPSIWDKFKRKILLGSKSALGT